MELRGAVNDLLARRTGYQLTRVRSEPVPHGLLSPERTFLLPHIRQRTMTSWIRIANLIEATRYLCRMGIEGAFVEFGVWRGGSAMAIAAALLDCEDCTRDLILFDTFAGMTAPTSKDVRRSDGRPAEELPWQADGAVTRGEAFEGGVSAYASLEDVKAGMDLTGYPRDKIHYIVGDAVETAAQLTGKSLALLRLDTDWYESTFSELFWGYPRLKSGGVLVIDDYDYWEGAQQATEQYFEQHGPRPMLARMDEGRIAIKL